MADKLTFIQKADAVVREPAVKMYMNDEFMVGWVLTLVNRDSVNFSGAAIGNAIPQTLTVGVKGKFSDMKDNRLNVEYLFDGESDEFAYPTFIVTEQKYDDALNITTFTAKDRLNELIGQKYNAKTDGTVTAAAFFEGFCSAFGFIGELDSPLSETIMPVVPNFAEEDNALTVLAKFAEFMCGNAFIKNKNVLCIKCVSEQSADKSIRINRGINALTVTSEVKPINRIVFSRGDLNDNVFYSETLTENFSDYAIINNPFIDNNDSPDSRNNYKKAIYNVLNGKILRSYSIEYRGNPGLQCGDVIALTGYDGNTFYLYYYGESFRFENGLKGSANIEFNEVNSYDYNRTTAKERLRRAEIKVDKDKAEIWMSISAVDNNVALVKDALSNTDKNANDLKQQLANITGQYVSLTGTLDGFRAEILKIEEDVSKNPSALKNTTVDIDINGITVGEYGEEVETNINASGLQINNVGGGKVAKFTKEGAVISNVATQTLNAAGTLFKLVRINGELWAAAYWIGEDDLWA